MFDLAGSIAGSASAQVSAQASVAAAEARTQSTAENLQDECLRLSRRIDRLVLVNAALWELLKERTGLTDVELQSKVLEVDARDGQVDGRLGGVKQTCPACGKTLHPKHAKCLYCGAEPVRRSEFEKV